MSIEERITEILGRHWLSSGPEPDSDPLFICECGEWFDELDDFNAHVARVLTTELKLTEEHAIGLKHPPFGRPGSLIDQDHLGFQGAREAAAASQDLTEYTRYVTPWENT